MFPDFERPNWETTAALQIFFMKWFNQERTKAILTFPVVTAAMLTENGKCKDNEFADQMAEELSQGNSFLSINPIILIHSLLVAVYVMKSRITPSLIH
ncbi:anaerobic ribonucleoside triphosphate reductase [Actinobacillus equuli]|nr:anaerobic ribonucleoside triphosphate reductase [Actinobacillus equuli]